MKELLKKVSVIVIGAMMVMPITTFAVNNEATMVSTEQVILTAFDSTAKSVEDKEFTLKTYNDNGMTVYAFDVEDENYRQAAMEYINTLTGDPGPSPQTMGILLPGESEYHNDSQTDGSALSYAWKRNTASVTANNFEGGQISRWTGSGNCDYIILNQEISVEGIGLTISWPPAVSGNGNSSSWQSQPISENIAGASFDGLEIGGPAFACTFVESGDVYKGSRIYRPVTNIKFSYFS